jgi:carbamoyltransferase
MIRILGLSAFYHDSAACLLVDGEIVAAVQEERFTRVKHDSTFPINSIRACLRLGNCSIDEVDYIVFYEKPFAKFERLLETYLDASPRGLRSYLKAIPLWVKDKLWIKDQIRRNLEFKGPILFSEHHESHAASAFYPSPFPSAAILTVDGVGEWTTTSLGRGHGRDVELLEEIRFPDSLGLLYSTFTYYLGFKVNSGEYKLMGLAPYGRPIYEEMIWENLITVDPDGAFSLSDDYFDYRVGLRMASSQFQELFGASPREDSEPFTQKHKDLAASIQKVVEKVLLRISTRLQQETEETCLCMAGGVALNCVANGRLLRESPFEQIWIQPASGDSGGALGAAMLIWHRYLENPRALNRGGDSQAGSLLGTSFEDTEIRDFLESERAVFSETTEEQVIEETSRLLNRGAIVGWFQGRMEFGPRALGNRSILADSRGNETSDHVNRKIKFRESYRPFAPVILEGETEQYFQLSVPSPYMLLVASVLEEKRAEIPAVTHVDGSARVQTVNAATNPTFHKLLSAFNRLSGCPVLLNTSFNIRGEPIVESPAQAYRCFMRTGMDVLVMNRFILKKVDQPTGL